MRMSWRSVEGARVAMLAVLVAVSGCGMIDQWTGIKTACDLRADGVPARAEILSIWDTGITVNDEPVIGLRVRVMPLEGADFEAQIPKALIGRLEVPQYQPGKIVPVIFSRADQTLVGLDVYACN